MKYTHLLLLPFFLLSGFGLKGQSNATLQRQLDSLRSKSEYPGVVFSYVKANGDNFTISSGWADKEANVAMTEDHLMHSGSTGKTVVSALVMQLVIDGLMELDAPIKTYFDKEPWFTQLPNANDITVRHLLQHSSGIQRYEFKDAFIKDVNADIAKLWEPEDLIEYVLNDTALFEAGKGFSYADTNYILVGMIIEQVTGKRFYDVAFERILKPNDLLSFTPTNTRVIANMAQGYYDPASEYALGFKSPFLKDGETQNNMQWEWTGGGYAYKTKDYARYLKLLYEGEVFDLQQVQDDYFGYIESPSIGGNYGLGVHRLTLPGIGEVIGHSGFFPGYNTAGFYHPESGMSFAMQINVTNLPQLRSFFKDYMWMIQQTLNLKEN